MTKLDKLKLEMQITRKLVLLPLSTRQVLYKFYKNAIDEIELYGAENQLMGDESVCDIENILKGWRKDGISETE